MRSIAVCFALLKHLIGLGHNRVADCAGSNMNMPGLGVGATGRALRDFQNAVNGVARHRRVGEGAH